ncbi:MAG: helix-turn-helix domain-containing protein [Gemmatimonadales bacterium]
MSPRPRTVDDYTILEAASRVMSRIGPERLTLADVGAEAGLSAATLVQRFGSKRDLMLSILRHGCQAVDTRFNAAMESNESPLESLFLAAMDRVGPREGPVTVANRLAFFMASLDDPEFHALALENSDTAIAGYMQMIDKAIEAGELTDAIDDRESFARTIHSMTYGSLIAWSIRRQGSLRGRVRRDLDALIRPFRNGPRKTSSFSRLDEVVIPEASFAAASPAIQ